MGDEIELRPFEGKALKNGAVVAEFSLKTDVLFDEVRAGGRIPLIIGRGLTDRARAALGQGPSPVFRRPSAQVDSTKGFTLAQKMVGKACGLPAGQGVRPGIYCEPHMTTVGSQDTTGPMTRDELKDLACLGFSADLVMQSFCHTAAYPKVVFRATKAVNQHQGFALTALQIGHHKAIDLKHFALKSRNGTLGGNRHARNWSGLNNMLVSTK